MHMPNYSMRVAFLLITYTNPEQTLRLINKLQHPDFDFYIHLDAKVDLQTHAVFLNMPQVYFIKNRVDVKWAGFSTVQAMLNSMEEIIAANEPYDFVHLMSGQDYPIKSTRFIHRFFEQHKGKEFVHALHFYTEWLEAVPRIEEYHLTDYSIPGKYKLQWLMNKVLGKRKPPMNYEFYGKSMFWTLSLPACKYVVALFNSNKRFKRFVKLTWAPDEFIIPTIIMNSPFRHNAVRENLLFVDMPEGTSHPKWLGVEDFPRLQNSPKLFARKFKLEQNPEIFDMLDWLTR